MLNYSIQLKSLNSLNSSYNFKNTSQLDDDNHTSINIHEFIKTNLMTRNKNAFTCPNFQQASIAPVIPEAVARDFQDLCFTTKYSFAC